MNNCKRHFWKNETNESNIILISDNFECTRANAGYSKFILFNLFQEMMNNSLQYKKNNSCVNEAMPAKEIDIENSTQSNTLNSGKNIEDYSNRLAGDNESMALELEFNMTLRIISVQ